MRLLVLAVGLLISTITYADHVLIQFSGRPDAKVFDVELIEPYYARYKGQFIPISELKSISNISAGLVGGPKWVLTLKDGTQLFPQSSVLFYRNLSSGYSPVLQDYDSSGMLMLYDGDIREVADPNKMYELTVLE